MGDAIHLIVSTCALSPAVASGDEGTMEVAPPVEVGSELWWKAQSSLLNRFKTRTDQFSIPCFVSSESPKPESDTALPYRYMYMYIHTRIYRYMYNYIHTRTYIYRYIHVYTGTCICTRFGYDHNFLRDGSNFISALYTHQPGRLIPEKLKCYSHIHILPYPVFLFSHTPFSYFFIPHIPILPYPILPFFHTPYSHSPIPPDRRTLCMWR